MIPIQYYCPEVTLDFLHEHCPVEPGFKQLMEVRSSLIQKQKAQLSIGFSFFKTDPSFPTGTLEPPDEPWREKYFNGLVRSLDLIDRYPEDCAVHLFVDPKVVSEVLPLMSAYAFLNVHVMKHSTNAATGMFWRFLVFDEHYSQGAAMSYVLDVDEDFQRSAHILCGCGPAGVAFYDKDDDYFIDKPRGAKKYTPLCGAFLASRAEDVEFDIAETVARFWYYQCYWQHQAEPRNEYNTPLGRMPLGFGNTWNLYGSDERFLSKVFYYTQRRKGKLNMVCGKEMLPSPKPAFEADWLFTKANGNQIYGH